MSLQATLTLPELPERTAATAGCSLARVLIL